jgi:DNA sulfur modification protein DndD
MKIKKLTITNFMPYKGKQEIEFPQHESQNVMLLFGDNMRGKTSFLNSIRWGFYGIALGRHLREIPRINMVNKDAAEEGDWTMSIVILFDHEGRNYELVRSIKKLENTTIPRNHADFSENIGLRINDVPVPGDAIRNEINQVMPREISRFFLFDGELLQEYENLLIENSDQGEAIKGHIESVLGVPSLIHAREDFQALLKDARSAQRKDAQKNNDLRKMAREQKSLEVSLESIETNLAQLAEQQKELQGKIDDLDEFLKNTEAVQSKKVRLAELEGEKKNLERALAEAQENINVLLKKVWADVLLSSVQPITIEMRKERNALQTTIEETMGAQREIDSLRKSIEESKKCNTCGQDIPESMQEPLKERLQELVNNQKGKAVGFNKLTELTQAIENLESIKAEGEVGRIIAASDQIRKSTISLISVENSRDDIEEEIRGIDTDEIMLKRDQREKWLKQLIQIELDIDSDVNRKTENIEKQKRISQLIAKHQGAEGIRSNRRVEILEELETVFTKGIDELRLKLKDDVEKHATRAFKQLSHEKTYSGLKINENYGLSILDQEGRILNERSAGAEQVVALSLIDGLNRTSGTKAPIVMDTPLGRLDPKHRKNILQYLPDMSEQVVLLVHEGEIDAKRDTEAFASRIGARYMIRRVSATQSIIEKVA